MTAIELMERGWKLHLRSGSLLALHTLPQSKLTAEFLDYALTQLHEYQTDMNQWIVDLEAFLRPEQGGE